MEGDNTFSITISHLGEKILLSIDLKCNLIIVKNLNLIHLLPSQKSNLLFEFNKSLATVTAKTEIIISSYSNG